jgi:uncharacterized protein (TIGR03437 family)
VVNPASFESGLVAGSLATIFVHGVRDAEGTTSAPGVPLPLDLEGVSVLVNGSPVPVHAVANVSGTEQVNFQAPFTLTPGTTASVVVRRGAASSPEVPIPVQSLQPAAFTSNGAAVVVHGNYQLVTAENPLREGEVAFFYAVGLGEVSNPPSAGAAAPSSPLAATVSTVRVSIGGVPAEVPFAGLAPGLVGVYQVNFRVPASIPSGSLSLIVGVGTEDSPPVQTLVV